ncbi:MAG: PH domain-containing protein [Candidatus Aenigmatarchaeota archaeon]
MSFPIFYILLSIEYDIMSSKYFIKEDSIEGEFGIIIKRRVIIPWKLVSQVSMRKNILGRIFDYGDILISTIGNDTSGMIIRGLKHPEKILNEIEERVGGSKIIF